MRGRCESCEVTWVWDGPKPAVKEAICGYDASNLVAIRRDRQGDQLCRILSWAESRLAGKVRPASWNVEGEVRCVVERGRGGGR